MRWIANNIPFGLSASIQTTNLSRAFDFIYRMEAGLLTVNLPSAGVEYQLPFGGTKDSASGRRNRVRQRWNSTAITRRFI